MLFKILAFALGASAFSTNSTRVSAVGNACIQFTVSSGTGCAWMCSYCANQLGTDNYYFVDGVCTYGSSGCVGNPMTGKVYTCCAL